MIRSIDGLLFKVHSPSDLELVGVRDDIDDPSACVRVRYTGLPSRSLGGGWFIDYRSKQTSLQRIFPSRAAAINLIASRQASA